MLDEINSDSLLRAIFNNTHNYILITDANLDLPGPKIIYANPAFLNNSGYTIEELKNKTPRILQGVETDRGLLDKLKAKCKKGEDFIGSTINYRKDGTKYSVQWNISAIKNKKNDITHYISVQQDISTLTELVMTLQKTLDLQQNIIVITNGRKLAYVNKAFLEFFGVESLEDFLLQDDCICSRFIQTDGFYSLESKDEMWIYALEKLPSEKRIVSMQGADNNTYSFLITINDYGDEKYLTTFTDITKNYIEKLAFKHKAYHDQLSGAYNREFVTEHFIEYKKDTNQKGLRLGAILLDIDHFKNVNDTYGHNLGDEVIKQIVNIAKEKTRADDYVIRWGGEEFVVLTQIQSLSQVKKVAEHLRKAIKEHSYLPVPKITASFGVALCKDYENLEALIKKADNALYEAKKSGRDRVVSYE